MDRVPAAKLPGSETMNSTLVATVIIAAGVGSGVLLCPVPWSPALLGIAAAFGCWTWGRGTDTVRIIAANCTAIFIALAVFESYLGTQNAFDDGTRLEGTIIEGFTHPDDELGYAPDPGSQVTARKMHGNEVVYDVVYTIDQDGRRVTPAAKGNGSPACLLLFGDSVTFGEGVNDEETFSFRVGQLLHEEYQVSNLAFSGYGPHQMLSVLEAGRVVPDANCSSRRFVYLAIPEHIARVAGLTSWDRHGPRYRLGSGGSAIRDGNFDDPPELFGAAVPTWLVAAFDNYHTCRRFFGRTRDPGQLDQALFLAVIRKAAAELQRRFPGSDFSVLFWDARDDSRIATVETDLNAAGIPMYRVTEAIPDLLPDLERYVISKHDQHPNPLQHQLIAEFMVRRMLGSELH